MSPKHYNIPIFIPEAACPHRCIFCNQYLITEKAKQPSIAEVVTIVETYLSTIPDAVNQAKNIEIAFFGGSFTGLPLPLMESYLQAVQPFINEHRVQSIRCSTRPDYINEKICDLLQHYHVEMVELGAQSFDDEVLKQSGRGHTSDNTKNAVQLLQAKNIPFGLQMMTGLPADSPEKSLATAMEIIRLGASNTRIYPCLVIKNTALEQLFVNGKFRTQTLEEAVALCAELVVLFEKSSVTVLRVGLHRSEGFDDGTTLISGPYHPQFKELVETKIWRNLLEKAVIHLPKNELTIAVPFGKAVSAIGFQKENRLWLEKMFPIVHFIEDNQLKDRMFKVNIV
ncbi:MAG: radical SAM protein [Bacteroidales bacterium]|nr:radical SAM protein [Bacteroidales bacterium]